MIYGLTDAPATLPRVRKLAIGDRNGRNGAPQKLDHFRLTDGPAIPSAAIVKSRDGAGQRPISLACTLAPLDPEQILSTKMRSYRASMLWCHGDNGPNAERRDPAGKFRPVQGGCVGCEHNPNNHEPGWRPSRGAPVCKANGRLYVILEGEGATEATMISTGSKWSIVNLSGFIRRLAGLGPQLWTIPLELRVTMQRISTPRGGGQRARTALPILSLHTSETVPQLMERVEAAAHGRVLPESVEVKLLPGPGVSDESVDAEPADPLLYPEAFDVEVEPVPSDDYLAALEAVAVQAHAEIGGRYIRPGFVVHCLKRGKAEDEIRGRLETAIHAAGAALPGEGPA
jgi:hypothetical protein